MVDLVLLVVVDLQLPDLVMEVVDLDLLELLDHQLLFQGVVEQDYGQVVPVGLELLALLIPAKVVAVLCLAVPVVLSLVWFVDLAAVVVQTLFLEVVVALELSVLANLAEEVVALYVVGLVALFLLEHFDLIMMAEGRDPVALVTLLLSEHLTLMLVVEFHGQVVQVVL